MKSLAMLSLVLVSGGMLFSDDGLLSRRYQEGEKLAYRMRGINEDWRYEIRATGVVKRDTEGHFEEFAWSGMVSNGAPAPLPDESRQFRQIVTLDPAKVPSMPDLSQVDPKLIGPITDFMAFYVDLWLAIRRGKLHQEGDHMYQKGDAPASWADGTRVVLGETSIDFDITLAEVNRPAGLATLIVKHVAPEQPEVRLPAAWMREPVGGAPNNWVNVVKKGKGYVAAVGQETFEVRLEVSLVDGKILSGTMENCVQTVERDCDDADLMSCREPRPRQIVRRIELHLE